MIVRLAAIIGLGLGLSSCATWKSSLHNRVDFADRIGRFTIEFSNLDRSEEPKIQTALEHAAPKLETWGGPHHPIRIFVLPNHQALEEAVEKPGFSWLRAWARYDEIFVQSPRTWGLGTNSQADMDDLLLHELAHCLMYQLSATRTTWRRKEIPLWFREGMASYTAEQGYRFASLEDLAQFYDAHPNEDPLLTSENLYREQNSMVYGAAHQAFTFLIKRYGRDSVLSVMKAMSAGATFPGAFREVLNISVEAFSEEFKRFVQWRGFR